MDILDSLKKLFDDAKVQEISKKVGINPDKIKATIDKVLPDLLGNLSEQLKSGKSSILSFLDKNKDGDIMDDVKNMFGGLFGKKKKAKPTAAAAAPPTANDVFADQKKEVTDLIKKECDVNEEKASSFLDEITNTVMGFLGQKKGEGGSMIENIIKQGEGLKGKFGEQVKDAMSFLDKDKDGDIMDDLEDMGKKMFGGLFGKKKKK